MPTDRNLKRMAHGIQAQCGIGYQKALYFAREHRNEIVAMIADDSGVRWKELPDAAAGLWRAKHDKG